MAPFVNRISTHVYQACNWRKYAGGAKPACAITLEGRKLYFILCISRLIILLGTRTCKSVHLGALPLCPLQARVCCVFVCCWCVCTCVFVHVLACRLLRGLGVQVCTTFKCIFTYSSFGKSVKKNFIGLQSVFTLILSHSKLIHYRLLLGILCIRS